MLWYLLLPAGALAAFAIFVFLMRARTLSSELDAELEFHAQHLLGELRPALLELNVVAGPAGTPGLIERGGPYRVSPVAAHPVAAGSRRSTLTVRPPFPAPLCDKLAADGRPSFRHRRRRRGNYWVRGRVRTRAAGSIG